MTAIVRQSVEQGALGVASSLSGPPGSWIDTATLVAMCKAAAPYGNIYSTHMRTEGQGVFESVAEAIRIGRQAGIPVDIIHLKPADRKLWGQMPELVSLIQQARASGEDVTGHPEGPCCAQAPGPTSGSSIPGPSSITRRTKRPTTTPRESGTCWSWGCSDRPRETHQPPLRSDPLWSGCPLVPRKPACKSSGMFGIIGWIIFGLIVGVIAKLLMPGKDPGGFIVTVLLGIAGAMLGGFLGRSMGIYREDQPAGFLMAVLGSIILLFLYRMFLRRRV